MTQLVPAGDFEAAAYYDEITDWLDKLIATVPATPLDMITMQMGVEATTHEIQDIYWSGATEGPLTQISCHRLMLRWNDIDAVLRRKWSDPRLVGATRAALRRIAEERFGLTVDGNDDDLVAYAMNLNLANTDVAAAIAAHRVDHEDRYVPTGGRYHVPVTAVVTPRWMHTVLTHLSIPTGREIAEHYPVGDPVPCPARETLEMALLLWEHDGDGPYRDLREAIIAAERLDRADANEPALP